MISGWLTTMGASRAATNALRRIPCATVGPPTCWKQAPPCALSRFCLGTTIWRPPLSSRASATANGANQQERGLAMVLCRDGGSRLVGCVNYVPDLWQIMWTCGSSAVDGRVCEQWHTAERVLPEPRFELRHTGPPSKETALGEKVQASFLGRSFAAVELVDRRSLKQHEPSCGLAVALLGGRSSLHSTWQNSLGWQIMVG